VALRRPKRAEVIPAEQTPRALTAATAAVDLSEGSSWKTWKFGNRDWQAEAWRLYDVVGELHFLASRIGDSLAQARLYVTEVDETGEETGEVNDPNIRRLAAVPLGTGAQRDDCLRLAGIDLAAGGECWIVGEGAATRPEEAEGSWFVVTGAAFSKTGDDLFVRRPKNRGAGGGKLKLTDGQDILIRCWRPHPNDIDQADAPTRPGIVPLREIELLTKREFAELDSRLTGAGMMFLPEGIDFPREENDPAGVAGFMQLIQRTAAASMRDQSTATAMVPIMATVPMEAMQYIDQMKPINFWSELSAEIAPMKVAAISRLASFYEIPSEVLEGIGNANHWTAWLVSEEGIRWIRGYLGLVADALTRGFLRLALASMGVPNPERYAFAFDTAPLAARPNRLDEAAQLHDRGLISDAEMVKAAAFSVEQMPSTEERAKQLIYKLVMAQPDLALDPEVQKILGLPAIKSVGLPPTAEQNADSDPVRSPESDRDEPPSGGAAPDAPDALTAALGARIAALAARPAPQPQAILNASAKLLIFRALELAGGRLATPAERRGRWRDIPRHELHVQIGPITPERAQRVTEGAWSHLPLVAADLNVHAPDLHRLLSGYVQQLLVHGRAHDDDLLFDALAIANRGQGLLPAEVTA
jgi:hypothetical protein